MVSNDHDKSSAHLKLDNNNIILLLKSNPQRIKNLSIKIRKPYKRVETAKCLLNPPRSVFTMKKRGR